MSEPTRATGQPLSAGPGPTLSDLGRAALAATIGLLLMAAFGGQPLLFALAAMLVGWIGAAWITVVGRLRSARRVELTLDADAGPIRARLTPIPVQVTVEVPGPVRLGPLDLRIRVSGEPATPPLVRIDAPPGATAQASLPLAFPRVGHWRIHGADIRLSDPWGLVEGHLYCPCELALGARPRPQPPQRARQALLERAVRRDRSGRHLNRRAGQGMELRELRDYVPGDPLKTVAWKATARRQRPLVRAFDEDTVRRVQLLVDIGPTMRAGEAGQAPLDRAIDFTAGALESLLNDRFGLTTFDHRVYGHLRPGGGRPHLQRALRHLMDLSWVVDEDLTETTDAELVARVGAFLHEQEGLPVARLEPVRSTVQARTLVDPLAEVFDIGVLYERVTEYLARERDRGHAALFAKARPAQETISARLRLFCALRGLPIPYRLTGLADARDHGLVDAIGRCITGGGADRLVIVSDLRGLAPDGDGVRAIRFAHLRKKSVVVVNVGRRVDPELMRALRASGARVMERDRARVAGGV